MCFIKHIIGQEGKGFYAHQSTRHFVASNNTALRRYVTALHFPSTVVILEDFPKYGHSLQTTMRYWWVNQNETYSHELGGGYLW